MMKKKKTDFTNILATAYIARAFANILSAVYLARAYHILLDEFKEYLKNEARKTKNKKRKKELLRDLAKLEED